MIKKTCNGAAHFTNTSYFSKKCHIKQVIRSAPSAKKVTKIGYSRQNIKYMYASYSNIQNSRRKVDLLLLSRFLIVNLVDTLHSHDATESICEY